MMKITVKQLPYFGSSFYLPKAAKNFNVNPELIIIIMEALNKVKKKDKYPKTIPKKTFLSIDASLDISLSDFINNDLLIDFGNYFKVTEKLEDIFEEAFKIKEECRKKGILP